MAQAAVPTIQGELMLWSMIIYDLFVITGFDLDNVLFELQKVKFPADKWKSLVNGLRLASAVPIIKADESDVVGKLQALISRWVKRSYIIIDHNISSPCIVGTAACAIDCISKETRAELSSSGGSGC